MSTILIQNALILQVTAAEATVLSGHDLLIEGNRFAAIVPAGQIDPTHGQTVIDAAGMLAMPGLINTHAHAPMVIFRGLAEDVTLEKWFNDYMWPLESNLQPEDVYWGMLLALAEMIEAGVTAVADHYFYMDETAKAVEKAGTRALLGWAMFGNNGLGQIDATGAFVQRWQNTANGRIRAMLAPHSPYLCDQEFLRVCVKKAQQLGVGIHIHLAETMGQTQASLEKHGVTPVRYVEQAGILEVPTILAHVCGATPEDIAILARYPAGIAHAPKTYFKLAMGFAPVIEFRRAGIPVGLATDGAVSNNTLDILESLRLMALGQKHRAGTPEVLTIHDALTIATQESARVYGQPADLGELAAGKLADVVLVDLRGAHHQPLYRPAASLIYQARAGDVHTVIVDGQILMRDHQLLTLDKAEIIDHVRQRMARLSQRVPAARIQTYQ